jgi:hypothetical protein
MCLIFLFAFAALRCSDEGNDVRRIDLNPFIELARSTICSDDSNRLFLIDDRLVFWDKRGNCPDNSYSFMLFVETPDSVLCFNRDSIGGPVGECDKD